jgi:hypothetical protein
MKQSEMLQHRQCHKPTCVAATEKVKMTQVYGNDIFSFSFLSGHNGAIHMPRRNYQYNRGPNPQINPSHFFSR